MLIMLIELVYFQEMIPAPIALQLSLLENACKSSQVKIQPSTKCDLLQKIAEDLSVIESRVIETFGDVGTRSY